MKDFIGNVLLPGDFIAHCSRQSSHMWINLCKIVAVKWVKHPYDEELQEKIVVRGLDRWGKGLASRESVISMSSYIVKVSPENVPVDILELFKDIN